MNTIKKSLVAMIGVPLLVGSIFAGTVNAAGSMTDYESLPPFLITSAPPLVMLVLGRDHKLYYEAYNDASDLNNDGVLDVGYKPAEIEYYGYFDSHKCYTYDAVTKRFNPSSLSPTKTCSGATEWSGDFLNYLTMSRMDVMRRVIYGGYRSTDTATETVLQRVYVPQEAHTWGKEYQSVAVDGYDIRDYTTLDLPTAGTRHLFASTTRTAVTNPPELRVLPNISKRIWEWVAKEGEQADDSLNTATTGDRIGHPLNGVEFDEWKVSFANAAHLYGSGAATQINGSGNPYNPAADPDDYYMTVFSGNIKVATKGTYQFAVDGDDAVELLIKGTRVAGYYGGHSSCNCQTYFGSYNITKANTNYAIEFRHEEQAGFDNYTLWWKGPDSGNVWQIVPAAKFNSLKQSTYNVKVPVTVAPTNYEVRVKVCDPAMPEANCVQYPNGNYKPTGFLQRYGESNAMYFGLMTGSYTKSTDGGVLRKNIGSITDEINASNGTFVTPVGGGIIDTINKLRIMDYQYASNNYVPGWPGAWVVDRPMNPNEFPDWGNPVGEILYESLRYFSGASPLAAYRDATMTKDVALGLPNPNWVDPYTVLPSCSKPFTLLISDINPSYDSDQLPGSDLNFGSWPAVTVGEATTALNVKTLANTIGATEAISGSYFIGQNGTTYDSVCSPKSVSNLGELRGLCPEEPTKKGSYYSASVAYYGHSNDMNPAANKQDVTTYSVGLSSPIPRIEIPVGTKTISMVPLSKSVGGCLGITPTGAFQPTNTNVEFYVDTLDPANPVYGKFRISFEDVEQAADHDMDAISEFEYQVLKADGTDAATPSEGTQVEIKVNSIYAGGCIIQHIGYTLSGTTADGPYLVVRDLDTAAGTDVNYSLDSPNVAGDLPLASTRIFTPGTTTAAKLIENPLYYAAKWGAFEDHNNNNKPDLTDEWDKDADGVPDTYFYVQNPLRLEEQLSKAFISILKRSSSGTAASVISSSRSGEGAMYQALFYPQEVDNSGNEVSWIGTVHSLWLDEHGNMREDCNSADTPGTCSTPDKVLDLKTDLIVEFYNDPSSGAARARLFKDAAADGYGIYNHDVAGGDFVADNIKLTDLKYLWDGGSWLADASSAQKLYTSTAAERYIFTQFGNTAVEFTPSSLASALTPAQYLAYLNPTTLLTDTAAQKSAAADKIVNFIRGTDQTGFRSRQIDLDEDGVVETWKLGDVIDSTPSVVSRPAENYDSIYKDESYRQFRLKYQKRRIMVYSGANDGGLHAFNGGDFDPSYLNLLSGKRERKFLSSPPAAANDYQLGAEMWEFIPQNLLPHLKWLTSTSYNHVYYVDLKPYIFDAKIFDPADTDHPGGWGTVLVGGMRFGGGDLAIDSNGDGVTNGSDTPTRSAYFMLDITNPEIPPLVLGEFTDSALGFTLGAPTAIPMLRCNLKAKTGSDVCSGTWPMDWYLAFGSGPHVPSSIPTALMGQSDQGAKMFVLKLGGTGLSGYLPANLPYIASGGILSQTPSLVTGYPMDIPVAAGSFPKSFFSDLIAVDYDLNFKTDVLYFGSVANTNVLGGNTGGMHRLVTGETSTTYPDPGVWTLNTLLDVGKPVTAAATASWDGQRAWVYFGTGRLLYASDKTDTSQQSYFGLKETYTVDAYGKDRLDLTQTNLGNLVDVSKVWVEKGTGNLYSTVDNSVVSLKSTGLPVYTLAAKTFTKLNLEIGEKIGIVDKYNGWKIDFQRPKERNLGQAALLGSTLTFTTYLPSSDTCTAEGESVIWAPYYRTGTAYFKPIIGKEVRGSKEESLRETDPVKGMTLTPSLHTGAEGGSTALIQTSTGAIIKVDQAAPGAVKSGVISWRDKGAE